MFDYQHISTGIKVTSSFYNSLAISEKIHYRKINNEEDNFVFPDDLDNILPNIGNDDTKDDFSGFGTGGNGFDGGGASGGWSSHDSSSSSHDSSGSSYDSGGGSDDGGGGGD